MFENYFKTAYRNLLKNKIHSFINLAGLSIGLASTIIINIFVNYESSFDGFYRQAANTYRVVQHTKLPDQTLYWNSTCYPLAEALRNDFPDFKHVTQAAGPNTRFFAVDRGNGNVVRFEEQYVLFVDTAYANVFDMTWLSGNAASALELKNSVVLTEEAAVKSFGTVGDYSTVLGKEILLNGKDPLKVTGVVANPPGNITLQYNILVPYQFFKENNPYPASNWSGNYGGTTFVVLKDNGHEEKLESNIDTWKKKYLIPEDEARISYFLQPLADMHNDPLYGYAPQSYMMPQKILNAATLVGVIILIIAAVNFVNLSTAKAITRSKEVGIRKTMGSTRLKLMGQFLYEHSLLIVVTLLISVGLSQIAIDQLNYFLTTVNLHLSFGWSDAGMILLIGCATILMAAFYPALVLSSFKPIDAVRNKIMFARQSAFSFRRILIGVQFTTVNLLIIAAIVVAIQIHHFQSVDLGFESERIITVGVPDGKSHDAFREKLLQYPGVTEVAFGASAPMTVDAGYGTNFRLPQQPVVEGKEAEMKAMDLEYMKLFDLKLIAGRNFTETKWPFDEFIVNEKVIKAFGWTPEEALGRKIMISEGEATIVGVVEDFHNESLQLEILPCVITNWSAFLSRAYIRLDNMNPSVLAGIETTWKEFAPEKVYSYKVLTDAIDKRYSTENIVFAGFSIFAGIAVAIGCMGLFGLASFLAVRRSKEIGIRKVLGATVMNVLAEFSKEFVVIVVIGFVVAVPIAWILMSEWLQGFAYKIELSWWMFASGGLVALVVALTTISFHSIRIGTSNPVDSLRNE